MFKRFFDVDHFLKVFIEFVMILLLLTFWFFSHKACGISGQWPRIEVTPPALEGKFLTDVPPGKSHIFFSFFRKKIIYFFIWLHQVLVAARRTFDLHLHWGMWDLVPWPGIEPQQPAQFPANLSFLHKILPHLYPPMLLSLSCLIFFPPLSFLSDPLSCEGVQRDVYWRPPVCMETLHNLWKNWSCTSFGISCFSLSLPSPRYPGTSFANYLGPNSRFILSISLLPAPKFSCLIPYEIFKKWMGKLIQTVVRMTDKA